METDSGGGHVRASRFRVANSHFWRQERQSALLLWLVLILAAKSAGDALGVELGPGRHDSIFLLMFEYPAEGRRACGQVLPGGPAGRRCPRIGSPHTPAHLSPQDTPRVRRITLFKPPFASKDLCRKAGRWCGGAANGCELGSPLGSQIQYYVQETGTGSWKAFIRLAAGICL